MGKLSLFLKVERKLKKDYKIMVAHLRATIICVRILIKLPSRRFGYGFFLKIKNAAVKKESVFYYQKQAKNTI